MGYLSYMSYVSYKGAAKEDGGLKMEQRRLGRFNAEAQRNAESRRGFSFSAFLGGSLRLCVDCSFQDEPKNSSRLTTKNTKNAKRGVGAERVFPRLVIAPVC